MNASSKTVLLVSVQEDLRSLGLRQVHYSLLDKGWQSILLYLPYARRSDSLSSLLPHVRQFVSEVGPVYVGFTVMSLEFETVRAISSYLKMEFPSLPIVWGGTHPTINPESCFPYASFVCIGEGEESSAELAAALRESGDPGQLPGICRLKNGRIAKGPFRPVIEDLDELPSADSVPASAYVQTKSGAIEALNEKLMRRLGGYRGKVYDVLASRGCPYSCAYCCNNVLKQVLRSSKVRRRSVENVILELEKAVGASPLIEVINFQDDCFLSSPIEYLKDFCREYRARINKPFVARSIPIYLSATKLSVLKEAGLQWLTMGLQSGSDRICREVYGRKSSPADFVKSARLIKEADIAAYYDVIMDNPFESNDERLATAEAILDIPRPFYLHFYSLTFYPGTPLHDRVLQELPQLAEEYYRKDYRKYEKTLVNDILRFSGFMPKRLVKAIIRAYRRNPSGRLIGPVIRAAKCFSAAFCEPLAALRVVMLSEGNSIWKALSRIPMYATDTLYKYTQQFSR